MKTEVQRRSRAFRWLHGELGDPGWGTRPDEYEPAHARAIVRRLSALFGQGRPWPVQVDGWEHVPPPPVLVVSNHSGGSTIPDCWGWGWAWYQHFGVDRPLHLLAHEVILSTRLTGPFFGRAGILRASRDRAQQALADWHRDVMVMPGGDRDVWRPWTERHRVRFCGHVGYARLALRTGVPIVPVAHCGPHDTLLVLSDGARLARRLKLDELFRLHVFPIHLSLPWGLGVGPLPTIPIPARLRYRIGAPIEPPAGWQPGAEPDEALVREHDHTVRRALQGLLDELAAEGHDEGDDQGRSSKRRSS